MTHDSATSSGHRRRSPWLLTITVCLHVSVAPLCIGRAAQAEPPQLGNGVKIGEVTSEQAIIWTRLTKAAEYKTDGVDFVNRPRVTENTDPKQLGPAHGYGGQVPPGKSLADMNSAVPGVAGEVRLTHWSRGKPDQMQTTPWTAVTASNDFVHQFHLNRLSPGTTYRFRVEGRTGASDAARVSFVSEFTTAPALDDPAPVSFTVVTGQRWQTRDDARNGQKIYPQMAKLNPSFFVHTGDIVYYDNPPPMVTHLDLARLKWNRMYALPFLRAFHNRVPSYFMKDDHDSWQNDDWPTMTNQKMGLFTWEQGRRTFLEQVPMGERTYRTARWGKDLQIWLVEGRDFRSPNDAPDGPAKTIWGAEQMEWFQQTVESSDATFRILISPTPIVGPDHLWKSAKVDNHVAAGRAYEGTRLRQFLGQQRNLFVVCGDRHWQYVSEDPQTGVREYACGPTTDQHATEIVNDDRRGVEYIRFKGGFLSVSIRREAGVPVAIFRHHAVDGSVQNEDRQSGQVN